MRDLPLQDFFFRPICLMFPYSIFLFPRRAAFRGGWELINQFGFLQYRASPLGKMGSLVDLGLTDRPIEVRQIHIKTKCFLTYWGVPV